MTNFVGRIFSFIFGNHSAIATIIISMFPIIEVKGAIPVGMSREFFGDYALNGTQALIFSLIGSSLVVPLIALLFTPILRWLKNTKFFRCLGDMIESKVNKAGKSINKKAEDETKVKSDTKKIVLKMLGVFLFVCVPIPLTGVWTGTCIGVAIGLKFWQTCVSVILGNIVASLIITFVCSVFPQITTILFFVVLAFVGVIIIYSIVKLFVKKQNDSIDE